MARETWTEAHVRRLFWRAGFGATPHEAAKWAKAGKQAAIDWLVRGTPGARELKGPRPSADGRVLDPNNVWGHDALWWLDRMVRTQRPLVEKLTLFWSDHFATSDQATPLMLAQNRTLRRGALGSFRALLGEVTRDPAMQLFLNLTDNDKDAPNENYAREMMELFTLGGGYTEHDVREAARALTGWRARWPKNGGLVSVRFDQDRHDAGVKRILGRSGRFGTDGLLDVVVAHPRHAPFITSKLWGFFVTRPLPRATAARLERAYRSSKLRIAPVVREILAHPSLYEDLDRPDMVKAPMVLVAGHLRAAGRGVEQSAWSWLLGQMGQQPFAPPSVAGWDWGPAWLSTDTMRARFQAANYLLDDKHGALRVVKGAGHPKDTPSEAVDRALGALGRPWVSARTREALLALAGRWYDDLKPGKPWQVKQLPDRADMLQRALRHLVLSGPDAQLH
jgi:uncharacterized protein (DUF1800 family)